MFNYNHLYYFYITAKLGGVMNASRFLKIAQPALSSQLKTFEKSIGHSLFEKSGRRMVLTPIGRRAYAISLRIFDSAEELGEFFKHSHRTPNRRLKIGVTPQIERPFTAALLASTWKIGKHLSSTQLRLIAGNQNELIDALRNQDIDLLIANQLPPGPDLRINAELRVPVVAVTNLEMAREFRLTRETSITSALLQNKNLGILLPGENLRLRGETDAYLQKKKFTNPVVFESDVIATLARAAAEGMGVAFLPIAYIARELKDKNLIRIGEFIPGWTHFIRLISRTNSRESFEIEKIRDHFSTLEAAWK